MRLKHRTNSIGITLGGLIRVSIIIPSILTLLAISTKPVRAQDSQTRQTCNS